MNALNDETIRIRPIMDWPLDDRQLWLRSCQATASDFMSRLSAFEPGGRSASRRDAARYEETTRINLVEAWGQYLEYLHAVGRLDISAPVAARAKAEWIFEYLKKLETLGRAPRTIGTRANSIVMFLAVVCPEAEISQLRLIVNAFNNAAPRTVKAGRIVSPTVLIQLGTDLVASVDPSLNPTMNLAIDVRDGLMIALLALRPIRLQTLTDLDLGSSFTKEDGRYWIRLAADQVKNDLAIDVPCPASLTGIIDSYLSMYRPVLLGSGPCSSVWVSSKTGTGLRRMGIYQAIVKRTRRALGFSVNPHLFRDCAATFMSNESPELANLVPGILGHSGMATARKHYIHGQSRQAHNLLQDVVNELRG